MTQFYHVETSHGTIGVHESLSDGPTLVMIHGNSSSGLIFKNQLEGEIGQHWRVIAPDLPGHGQSSNAISPERTYSIEGYADAIAELLNKLEIQNAIVFGWSLGGHIGIELISRYPSIRGLMITGTPPVAHNELSEGFKSNPDVILAGKEILTEDEVEAFARSTSGEPFEQSLVDVVRRSDGQARRLMFEKFGAGTGADQRRIVETTSVPIAVVNGKNEPFVYLDFISNVRFKNLWRNETFVIDNAGHSPFRETPDLFNIYLSDFINDLAD